MGDNTSRNRLAGVRVLFIDDEPDARELITCFLESTGAEVVTAASAKEAFDTLAAFRPTVLVSDIGMPVEDGYSFIRSLRAFEADVGEGIPSLALTAYASLEYRAKALAAGFDRHIGTPVDLDMLVSAIADLAASRPHRNEVVSTMSVAERALRGEVIPPRSSH
jgi:CheY-like chemotaxis protein